MYLKFWRGREICGFFFFNQSGYSFNALEICIFYLRLLQGGGKEKWNSSCLLVVLDGLSLKCAACSWDDQTFIRASTSFCLKYKRQFFKKIFLFWLLLLCKYHLSSSSKRGKSIGRGLSGPAVQHQQHTEPWAQARCLANPDKLINVDNPVDSGAPFCICQGIKYVYGKKCNYSIFRCAIHATSCINFLSSSLQVFHFSSFHKSWWTSVFPWLKI